MGRAAAAPREGASGRRYLLRFGYDGAGFSGWARQPGERTVEGELLRGLVRQRIVPSAASAELEVGSRTDRGVSARANALTLRAPIGGVNLLRALNGLSPSIWFTGLSEVPEAFRVRAALGRWYRYWERPAEELPTAWSRAAERLTGPVDARSFGRGLPADRPSYRTIDLFAPRLLEGWLVVDVRARSFVWGMVRKLVAAARAVEEGQLTLDRLSEAAEGRARLTLPMAEPERLVLWEASYPIDWTIQWSAAIDRRDRSLALARRSAAARARILEAVHPPDEERAPSGPARVS